MLFIELVALRATALGGIFEQAQSVCFLRAQLGTMLNELIVLGGERRQLRASEVRRQRLTDRR